MSVLCPVAYVALASVPLAMPWWFVALAQSYCNSRLRALMVCLYSLGPAFYTLGSVTKVVCLGKAVLTRGQELPVKVALLNGSGVVAIDLPETGQLLSPRRAHRRGELRADEDSATRALSEVLGGRVQAPCVCGLVKEIGFTRRAHRTYTALAEFYTLCEDGGARGALVTRHQGLEERQLLCSGTARLVVERCTMFWSGCEGLPLTREKREQLDAFLRENQALTCIAYANRQLDSRLEAECRHTPVAVRVGNEAADSSLAARVESELILLGLVLLAARSIAGAGGAISCIKEQLHAHFLFFSAEGKAPSVALSSKYGFGTEWNTVVSARQAENGESVMDDSTRLPRGVDSIRECVQQTGDDTVLKVPVFCDCDDKASDEMLSVLHEHGEVVL
eukprot:m51a1_g13236 hypothetical protein (392) ;mRNA; f:821-2361